MFVNRSNPEKSRKSIDAAAEAVRRGRTLLIFPEGTRSEDGNLRAFKKGGFVLAAKTGVPLVPVYIDGANGVMEKGAVVPQSGEIVVRVGSPIDSSRYSVETKEELMTDVFDAISSLADAAEAAPVRAAM